MRWSLRSRRVASEMEAMPPWPLAEGHEDSRICLRGGSTVLVRPVRAEDEPQLRGFLEHLCPTARRLRFFSAAIDVRAAAHRAAEPAADACGLLALAGDGKIVGHALYVRIGPSLAEVAVEVADRVHGEGLGTILIGRLAEIAERRGITRFVAEVLSENKEMLDVFHEGFGARVTSHRSERAVEFPTSSWRLARERFDRQSRSTETACKGL